MPEEINISRFLLTEYRKKTILAYNRLEGNPRSSEFGRSISAGVHDAMWMLTRQWQFGEFKGDDAASPINVKVVARQSPVERVKFAGANASAYDPSIPLETFVERESIKPDLGLAVRMARQVLRSIKKERLETSVVLPALLEKYPLRYEIMENDFEGRQLLTAVTGKIFDGFSLLNDYAASDGSSNHFAVWISSAFAGEPDEVRTFLTRAAEGLSLWYEKNFSQPVEPSASCWQPSNLDYSFKLGYNDGSGQKVLDASQYSNGQLDWHSFDLDASGGVDMAMDDPREVVTGLQSPSFLPTMVKFKGMPHPRFWQLEDNTVDFGKIDAGPTGHLHLLFAEFGLMYSNDWFVVPYPVQANTVCEIHTLVVTDVFGEKILVKPAGRGLGSNWQRWGMFEQTDLADGKRNTNIFYKPPVAYATMKGEPVEKVVFMRDEMANMVWGIESVVPSQSGFGMDGNFAALPVAEEPVAAGASPDGTVKYRLGTTIAANWIPFIPAHIEGNASEIRLQRARFPQSNGPRTAVLNEKPTPYFIFEEEIGRAGVVVERSFQRTRWYNGATFLWIGRSKKTGRGEGLNNLHFDQIKNPGS